MQAVNASSTQLGILSAAWQIAMLAQIPAAFIAESMTRRKPFWATVTTLHRILWASPALLPWLFPDNRELWPVFLIAALGLSNLLANSGTASWLSWMADLVPPESAGRFWALRQLVLSLSMIVCTALYGWLLDHYAATDTPFLGFQWVFALCSLFGIADIVVHCFVHEPEHRRTQERKTCRERFASPFRNRGFTVLTAAMAGWVGAQSALGYTMGVPGFFSMVHLREAFGASYSQASMVFISACVGAAIFTPWLGSWMDRAGSQNVLTRLVFLGPISMAAWWIAKPGTWNLLGFARLHLDGVCRPVSGGHLHRHPALPASPQSNLHPKRRAHPGHGFALEYLRRRRRPRSHGSWLPQGRVADGPALLASGPVARV
jgi:MFS-type transporter involved in bile tolerance (Atg22 family)